MPHASVSWMTLRLEKGRSMSDTGSDARITRGFRAAP